MQKSGWPENSGKFRFSLEFPQKPRSGEFQEIHCGDPILAENGQSWCVGQGWRNLDLTCWGAWFLRADNTFGVYFCPSNRYVASGWKEDKRATTNVQNGLVFLFTLKRRPWFLEKSGGEILKKVWKSMEKCEKVWKVPKRFCPSIVAL